MISQTAALIGFVNGSFTQALGGNGAIYDPFGMVAVLTLLAGIYYNIITRSYRLITMIPEWIMRWMGAEGVNRGDGGGESVHGSAMSDTQNTGRSAVTAGRQGLRRTVGNGKSGGAGPAGAPGAKPGAQPGAPPAAPEGDSDEE